TRSPSMWNFSKARLDRRSEPRGGTRSRQKRGPLEVESLEQRKLLNADGPGAPMWQPANTNPADVEVEPMASLGQALIEVYRDYQQDPSDVSGLAARFQRLQFQGDMVAIGVNGRGDFTALLSSLRGLGMQLSHRVRRTT